MSERRVVITGIGCLSPLGNDLATTWDGMKAGRSGIARITHLDPEPFDCKIAGEVKNFVADPHFNVPKDARRADRLPLGWRQPMLRAATGPVRP